MASLGIKSHDTNTPAKKYLIFFKKHLTQFKIDMPLPISKIMKVCCFITNQFKSMKFMFYQILTCLDFHDY